MDLSQRPADGDFFRSFSPPLVFTRVCIFLILCYTITYAVQYLANLLLGAGASPLEPLRLMIREAIGLAGACCAAWILSRWEKRPFGDYGLPRLGMFGAMFWQGALFGLIEISAVIAAIAARGEYHFGAVLLHGGELFRWAIYWAIFFLIVGLYEEFIFRGYPQFTWAQGIGFWPAAVMLSVLFGAFHIANKGETWPGIGGVILTGLFWCFTLRRTGTLWFAVGMHAAFDFGETFLYSVPDSGIIFPGHLSNAAIAAQPVWLTGGTAGPEASVCDFVILLVFFFIFHRFYPAKPMDTQ